MWKVQSASYQILPAAYTDVKLDGTAQDLRRPHTQVLHAGENLNQSNSDLAAAHALSLHSSQLTFWHPNAERKGSGILAAESESTCWPSWDLSKASACIHTVICSLVYSGTVNQLKPSADTLRKPSGLRLICQLLLLLHRLSPC